MQSSEITRLDQLQPGQLFRVAGASVHMKLHEIRIGAHTSTIRVENTDTRIGYVYHWENATRVYNVV